MKIYAVALAFCTFVFATSAVAQTVTLRFNSPTTARSTLNTQLFAGWVERVNATAPDAVKVELFVGGALGHIGVTYDRVIQGAADIGFIPADAAGGKFQKTAVASLPFESESGAEISVALWNLFELGVISSEYDQVKPLATFAFPRIGIHSKHEITALDHLAGKKIAAQNQTLANIIANLGGVPILLRPDEQYQALSTGVVSGVIVNFTALQAFKFPEVTDHHLDAGLGSIPALVFMNKQSYEKLSDAGKKAIDMHSGLGMSRTAGEFTDGLHQSGVKLVEKSVNRLSEAERKRWNERVQPVIKTWMEKTPDGGRVLAELRREIAKFRASSR